MIKLFLIFWFAIILSFKANCQTVSGTESLSVKINAGKDSSEKVYLKVDKEADFPGGQNAWLENIIQLDMTTLVKPVHQPEPIG